MPPNHRVGIGIGGSSTNYVVAVVAMSTELGQNKIRDFAYQVGKAIGSLLTEEEQQCTLINFKGKNTYIISNSALRSAWREFSTVSPRVTAFYTWRGSVASIALEIAQLIKEYMDGERVQARRERDPSLPDHVFESAMIQGDKN